MCLVGPRGVDGRAIAYRCVRSDFHDVVGGRVAGVFLRDVLHGGFCRVDAAQRSVLAVGM